MQTPISVFGLTRLRVADRMFSLVQAMPKGEGYVTYWSCLDKSCLHSAYLLTLCQL